MSMWFVQNYMQGNADKFQLILFARQEVAGSLKYRINSGPVVKLTPHDQWAKQKPSYCCSGLSSLVILIMVLLYIAFLWKYKDKEILRKWKKV